METRFVLQFSEIACERSSVVAIAHSNDLAVDLNKKQC